MDKIKIKVGEVNPLISPQEALDKFDATIELFKVQNTPEKYESQKEDIARQRAKLIEAIKPKKGKI
jgi:hypothetical protein